MARTTPTGRLVAALAAALCAIGASAGSAAAAEPIEGTWSYQGGRVLVERSAPGAFRGTVTARTRFLECDHPVGERMWEITGSGLGPYSGTHQWYEGAGCTTAPGGLATWSVRERDADYLLDFCTAPPDSGPPDEMNAARVCTTLRRAKPPAPSPDRVCLVGACIVGPGVGIGCVPRGDFRHRFRVVLTRRARKRLRVKVVQFRLDSQRNGRDRRRPFFVLVRGDVLTPGSHVLSATVVLRKRRGRGTRRMSLKYTFNACD